jgi:hypothetical protein
MVVKTGTTRLEKAEHTYVVDDDDDDDKMQIMPPI